MMREDAPALQAISVAYLLVGDAGVDAGPDVSTVAAGEPAALPPCGFRYVVVLYEPPRRGATSIAGPRSQRCVPIQRHQPRCEPCHTQSETELDGPVI
jgi:hypothetical protein